MKWVKEQPDYLGHWWYCGKLSNDCPTIVYIWENEGSFLAQFFATIGGVMMPYHPVHHPIEGVWSDRPIKLPAGKKE